mmetsp:Transcript_36365/g.82436  ORF Transcript_36365/g.82436 Transcript_36365/m.82436 type:complete len:106 (-) Transcript_36365:25-342(-)
MLAAKHTTVRVSLSGHMPNARDWAALAGRHRVPNTSLLRPAQSALGLRSGCTAWCKILSPAQRALRTRIVNQCIRHIPLCACPLAMPIALVQMQVAQSCGVFATS